MTLNEVREAVIELETKLQETGADNVAISTVFLERADALNSEFEELAEDD